MRSNRGWRKQHRGTDHVNTQHAAHMISPATTPVQAVSKPVAAFLFAGGSSGQVRRWGALQDCIPANAQNLGTLGISEVISTPMPSLRTDLRFGNVIDHSLHDEPSPQGVRSPSP